MANYKPYMRENREYESNIHKYRIAVGMTVKELAEKAGTSPRTIFSLANGMAVPYYFSPKSGKARLGKLKPYVKKIVEILGVPLDELFPRYICDIDRGRYLSGDNFTLDQMPGICIGSYADSELTDEENESARLEIFRIFKTLTKKERTVLYLIFWEGETYSQIGEYFANTGTRIMQISEKALRKMRHPSRSKTLWKFIK